MNLRTVSNPGPYIACVLAAGEVQDRMNARRSMLAGLPKAGRPPCDEPCLSDFGLSARESGAWGRLRAEGLSAKDAADVVKAARQ